MAKISPDYVSKSRVDSNHLLDSKKIKQIYIFTEPHYKNRNWEGNRKGKGFLKIGETTGNGKDRVRAQHPVKGPDGEDWEYLFECFGLTKSNKIFGDTDVHKILKSKNIQSRNDIDPNMGKEWFECTLEEAISAIYEIIEETEFSSIRTENYKMRPEQENAVAITSNYFKNIKKESGRTPKFLWNAKMRFGKTFTTYQLAKKMNWSKILVLTYVPAVENEWFNALNNHVDFEGWKFLSNKRDPDEISNYSKVCYFSSLQDILGEDGYGGVKEKFEEVFDVNWDCIVIDEYHFGARTNKSKKTIDQDTGWKIELEEAYDGIDFVNLGETNISEELISRSALKTDCYLFLSGTPFKSLEEGEFNENQIYSWSYVDEQLAKKTWNKKDTPNPYEELPQMVVMTYEIPDDIKQIALDTELNEFNISEFFSASKNEENKFEFNHKNEVQKWLEFIRGDYLVGKLNRDSGNPMPVLPFYDTAVKSNLNHTLWMLPTIGSCNAMENLLNEHQNNKFIKDYEILNISGSKVGSGLKALEPVSRAIKSGLDTKTITLTCGKLNQGVTVSQWGGVFMLRNMESPQFYFQTIFRCQSPWKIENLNKDNEIIKEYCYVFDFSINRTLKRTKDFIDNSQISGNTLEEKVATTLNFLPVLAYNGLEMEMLDARSLISIATGGLGMKMLSRRWASSKLVKVDNFILDKLLKRPDLIKVLEDLPFFNNTFGEDIEIVVSKEKALQQKSKNNVKLNKSDKDDKKKNTSKREQWRKNCQIIIQRIPVFMYLTDYREDSLSDVILKIEPGLFKEVTFIDKEVFEDLCNIGLFNAIDLDHTIGDFRRLEEASLQYMGGGRIEKNIGLLDTVVSKDSL